MRFLNSGMHRILALTLCLFALAGCKTELHTNLSERDANEVLAALLSEGMAADKISGKDGFTVRVSSADFGFAVETLSQKGLPKRRFDNLSDVFDSDGLVASPIQEWAKLNYAKAQELSASISEIPGVVRADVHIGEIRKESPFQETEPPSASVLIQMKKEKMFENLVPQVKRLISLAHPEIQYERVGVMVTPIEDLSENYQVAEVAGFRVHKADVFTFQMVAIGLGALLVGLCSLSTFTVLRLFQQRKEREQ